MSDKANEVDVKLQPVEPTKINFNDRWFTANGKKYYVSDRICIERWKEYEKLSPRITYDIGFDTMQKKLTQAYEALNKQQFANAAVIIHNILNGVKDVNDDKRVHPSLLMAALLINGEGEDIKVFDKQTQLQKIDDWQTEGLDILGFFSFALSSINGFRETYLLHIRDQVAEIQKEINKS